MVKLSSSRLAGQHLTPFQRGMFSAVMAVVLVGVIYGFLGVQKQKIHTAKEAVLREDCRVVHQAIDNYTVDLHKAPKSLDDVVQGGYLKTLPKDFSLEACR
jgi:general secretion pathway protein G